MDEYLKPNNVKTLLLSIVDYWRCAEVVTQNVNIVVLATKDGVVRMNASLFIESASKS
jgi:hypothetical protein